MLVFEDDTAVQTSGDSSCRMTAPLVSTLMTSGGGKVGAFAFDDAFIFCVDIAEHVAVRTKVKAKR